MPAPKSIADQATVKPSYSVSGDAHFRAMTRRNLGELLFTWATDHSFPQFHVHLPSGRVHTIVSGAAAWRVLCFEGPLEIIEPAIEQLGTYQELPVLPEAEQAQRLALIELGRTRKWARFVWQAKNHPDDTAGFSMVLDGGEVGWTRYAYNGRYERVCEVCELLMRVIHVEADTPRQDLQQVRRRFLKLAEGAGYPELRFQVAGDGVVYKVAPGGQAEYEDRAASATLGWLWNAVRALEKQYGVLTSDDALEA
jgi:hypothetical protein